MYIFKREPKELEFIYFKIVYLFLHIYTSENFKVLSIWCNTLIETFSTAQNCFWTHRLWCVLVLLPFFVSSFPHLQNVSLWGFFIQVNKKNTQGEIRWIGKVGDGGHAIFGQKLLNTQHDVSRYTYKSPIMKWKNTLKDSSKKFTEVEHGLSPQYQLVQWYRCVPRTLI